MVCVPCAVRLGRVTPNCSLAALTLHSLESFSAENGISRAAQSIQIALEWAFVNRGVRSLET